MPIPSLTETENISNSEERLVFLARNHPEQVARILCSPHVSNVAAVKIFLKLYADYPEVLSAIADNHDPESSPRIVDLLSVITNTSNLGPMLLKFLDSDKPYVRARVSQIIARNVPLKGRLTDILMNHPDSRVRANVVEEHNPLNMDLVRLGLRDPHHRVVCNAVVRLAERYPEAAVSQLSALVKHADWQFRAAAAWAIGQCARLCPEYTDLLSSLVAPLTAEEHAKIRWNAIKAKRALLEAASLEVLIGEASVSRAASEQQMLTQFRENLVSCHTDSRNKS